MTLPADRDSPSRSDDERRRERTYTVTRSGEVVVDVQKLMRSPAFRKSRKVARRIIEREQGRTNEKKQENDDR